MPFDLNNLPQERIAAFCERNGIRRLAIFGSALRDDFAPDSDIDVLVEFEPDRRIGFLGLEQIQNDLSDLFGRTVDLRTTGEMQGRIGELVRAEAQPIYDAA